MDEPVLVNGLWVPDGDMQLINGLQASVKKTKRPVVDGKVAWRYDRIAAALKFLPEDRRRVAVDIGAHIGLWTRWLARDFMITYAFEPVSHFYDLLQRNLMDEYKHVFTFREGLGEWPCRVGMVVEKEVSGRSHVQLSSEDNETISDIANIRTLDSWNFHEVDFIKIDVEGWESRVVRGAEEVIRRDKPVIVIEQLGHEVRYGDTKMLALDILKGWGMVELIPNMKGDYYLGWEK